jgi:hypothetical protein
MSTYPELQWHIEQNYNNLMQKRKDHRNELCAIIANAAIEYFDAKAKVSLDDMNEKYSLLEARVSQLKAHDAVTLNIKAP